MLFETDDLSSGEWTANLDAILPASPRHGTVLPITAEERERLVAAFPPAETPVLSARRAPELLVGTTAFGDPGFVDLGAMGWVMLFALIGGMFSVYAAATVVTLVVEADRGQRLALGAALRSALRPTAMALVAILLLVLAGIAASLASVVVALVPFVGFVVLLAAMPIGIGVAVSLGALVAPIAVVERRGPLATLGRALWVLRVRFWRTIGIAWLLLIVLLGVSLSLSIVLEAVAAATGPAAWAVLALSTVLLSVVQLPVVSIAALLVFLDARMLREAFDLEIRLTHLAAG
jgi:hypothetical protein